MHFTGAEKFHAQTSWGDRRDQSKGEVSSNYRSDMHPCSATDHHSGVWLRMEIMQNHWRILGGDCMSYQFRADAPIYTHRSQYKSDDEAEIVMCAQKCQVSAW